MPQNLQIRKMSVPSLPSGGPSTFDAEARTVGIVAATESPVRVWDWDVCQVVDEVLLMDGLVLPEGGQVPLLDSHNSSTVNSVLGSVRGFKVVGDELHAEVTFARDDETQRTLEKVRDDHLTDVSVGYLVREATWIPEGEKGLVGGREFTGPLKVATQWSLAELSFTPIGADPRAKTRSMHREEMNMSEFTEEQRTPSDNLSPEVRAERERVVEIRGLCRIANLDHLSDDLVSSGATLERAREVVFNAMRQKQYDLSPHHPNMAGGGMNTPSFEMGRTAEQKRMSAAVDGLAMRYGVRLNTPSPGADEYRGRTPVDIARECLTSAGVSTRGMGAARIVETALSQRAHMTVDFPKLLGGLTGRVLEAAYQQVPSTWEAFCATGDASDFRDQWRLRASEMADLDQIGERGEYKYGALSESGEKFKLYTYGKLFALTRQAIINDDLGAFVQIPQGWAMSAKRKINALVYSVLTSNPTMADSVALFHASHSNLGTAGVISVTTLGEARKLMRLQKDVAGKATLNIAPRFLIVPATQETLAEQVVSSISLDTSGNMGIVNPFSGKLQVVCDPILDASSTTAWYLAAEPVVFPAIEVCFLDGRKTPYLEERTGWTVDGVEFKCRIDVGVGLVDYRPLVKNAGA